VLFCYLVEYFYGYNGKVTKLHDNALNRTDEDDSDGEELMAAHRFTEDGGNLAASARRNDERRAHD
jgi:hypothetical protein